MAVEELASSEASEGIMPGTRGFGHGRPPADDANLAPVVESLKLTTEKINVPPAASSRHEPPHFRSDRPAVQGVALSVISWARCSS